ncbi:hypothetical protein C6P45_005123 [Maudiozyma exigua]|uniref:Zn(2)-C6 fungal-type domain-containing protein n=1 Tax=Maudiozyma exigua TaxID=34358 RepID=A0A9P6W9A5_MAUEX|nr:hypothetical protein C6P45_005123 [Kazachstania exigua]
MPTSMERETPPHSSSGNSISKNPKLKHFRKTQACDRCRLKKIKCDGIKPSCSNCAKIKFNCTFGDKLARRGLPKGYTESLEQEVIRLQELLNTKGINPQLHQEPQTTTITTTQDGPLPFAFINDNFHRFENYSLKVNPNRRIFLGHRTWNKIFKNGKDKIKSDIQLVKLNSIETNLFDLVKQQLKLNSNNYLFPQFLINQYKNDTSLIKSQLVNAINQCFLTINSLVPVLYPFDIVENDLIEIVMGIPQHTDSTEPNTLPSLAALLTLQYIIQINWNCHDDMVLYQLTKMIVNINIPDIDIVQCLNLSIYYFMGNCPTISETSLQEGMVNDLINLTYSKILSMSLFINPKNLVDIEMKNSKENKSIKNNDENDSIYNVTFWCFQFLNSWWSLTQGLPKINFLIDEFQPKELRIPILKSFSLLVDLIVRNLDGTNLQMILQTNEKSKLVLCLEHFRQELVHYKLYHTYFDHDQNDQELLSNNITTSKTLILEKTEFIEINLTLFYLVLTLFTKLDSKPKKSKSKDKDDSIEGVCYEILSLYYLLILHYNSMNIKNSSTTHQPLKFNLFHFLPITMVDLIDMCENKLSSWSDRMSKEISKNNGVTNKKILKNQYYWKFNKFKQFLIKWSLLWYQNDFAVLEQKPFFKSFNIDISIFKINERYQSASASPSTYLKQVVDFNDSMFNITYNNSLIRSNSKTVMEQFNLFANNMNNLNNTGMVSTSRNLSTLFKSLTTPKLEEINNGIFSPQQTGVPTVATTTTDSTTGNHLNNNEQEVVPNNDLSHADDPLYLLSPLFVGDQEDNTDDGYAEDDDEASCDNMGILEIPFKSKRRAALFQTQINHQPVSQNDSNQAKSTQLNVKNLLSPTSVTGSSSKKPKTENNPGYMFYSPNDNGNHTTADQNIMLTTSQQQSPTLPLPRTNSLLNSRIMPPPFPGTSITSISQLLIPSATDDTNSNTANKNIIGLPTLPEVGTPKSFVNMLLLPSSASASTNNTASVMESDVTKKSYSK